MAKEHEHEHESQRTPFLHSSTQHGNADIEQGSKRVSGKGEIFQEVKNLLWLAVPLISVALLNFCIQIISVMIVGHLGELPLAASSLATSFVSVTSISLLLGMACALDTLCGQSFGANQPSLLGLHTQRAMVVLMIVSIPLAIICLNTRSILIFLGQDPEISVEAGVYAQLMVPSIFAYGLIQCLNRFLQTQNIVLPMVFCSAVTTVVHILLCWIMVFEFGLGIRGAAISNTISYWVNVLILTLFVKFSGSCAETWKGFSKEALHGIPSFLRIAIPSAVMICLEMWSYELVVLLSGLLPNPKLETSVLSICLNTASTVWMVHSGFSEAISIRVSNELGADRPHAASLAIRVVIVMAIVEGTLVGIVMILLRNIWGYAFSNEVEVIKYVAIMLPIVAGSNFGDGILCVLSGTVRGCGWQELGAFINLGSCYGVGIPCAIIFAFVLHIGGKGLWLGMICQLLVQLLFLSSITLRTDWEKEAKKARDRVYDSIVS